MKKIRKSLLVLSALTLLTCVPALTSCNDGEESSSVQQDSIVGTYKVDVVTDLGTDTFTLTLEENGVAKLEIKTAIFTDLFTGTYTSNGNEVEVKGLTSETAMTPHPGLWGNIIDSETGDCNLTVNKDDGSFTFKDTGKEGGLPDGIGGGETGSVWENGTTHENVSYGTSESQTMDIYVPNSPKESLPLIVTIHGGAFKMGDADMMSSTYEYFRDNGYVAASINYTLGENTYPQAIIDCKNAVQFLVDNASTYKIDVNNITVMGESAGAYLAVMTSMTPAFLFKENMEAENYTFDVKNLVDFYGPIYKGEDGGIASFVGENETPMTSCNPESYLKDNTDLNVWIQAGSADTSVDPLKHSKLFADALIEAGYNVSYELIDGAAHMGEEFYTTENLSKVKNWLENEEGGEVVVPSVETYTYSQTKVIMGSEKTETTTISLTDEDTITLTSDGVGPLAETWTGSYVKDGTNLYVYGLANEAGEMAPGLNNPINGMMKFDFVNFGTLAVTLNETESTFVPVEGNVVSETVTLSKENEKPAFIGGGIEVLEFVFAVENVATFNVDSTLKGSGNYVKYGDVYVVVYDADTSASASQVIAVVNEGYSIIKVNGTSFDVLLEGKMKMQ